MDNYKYLYRRYKTKYLELKNNTLSTSLNMDMKGGYHDYDEEKYNAMKESNKIIFFDTGANNPWIKGSDDIKTDNVDNFEKSLEKLMEI